MRRVFSIVMALLALTAGCSWSKTDSPSQPDIHYVVSGTVNEYPGDLPIEGALVKYQNRSATTASDGSFVLRDLQPVSGDITAEKAGYLSSSQILTVSPGRVEYSVRLFLAKNPS